MAGRSAHDSVPVRALECMSVGVFKEVFYKSPQGQPVKIVGFPSEVKRELLHKEMRQQLKGIRVEVIQWDIPFGKAMERKSCRMEQFIDNVLQDSPKIRYYLQWRDLPLPAIEEDPIRGGDKKDDDQEKEDGKGDNRRNEEQDDRVRPFRGTKRKLLDQGADHNVGERERKVEENRSLTGEEKRKIEEFVSRWLTVPNFLAGSLSMSNIKQRNIWAGSFYSSGIHFDGMDNLLCVLTGYKEVWLYPANCELRWMCPFKERGKRHQSRVGSIMQYFLEHRKESSHTSIEQNECVGIGTAEEISSRLKSEFPHFKCLWDKIKTGPPDKQSGGNPQKQAIMSARVDAGQCLFIPAGW
mmetsp:Transcript_19927/g.48790  ORF Transcript_19927/g.48790 Transcript_19927/m.48790 type:complete len:354 (-) Transcript_19927:373-1434(-)